MDPALSFPDGPRADLEQSIGELMDRAQAVLRSQGRLRHLLAATWQIIEHLQLSDVERNVVTIRVTRKAAHQLGDQVYIDERPRGEFVRQLYLGESLDSARVTAERGDGLLTLHIPVDPASKPRRVEIGHNPTNPSPTNEGKQ